MVDKVESAGDFSLADAEVANAALTVWLSGADQGDIADAWKMGGFPHTADDLKAAIEAGEMLERNSSETLKLLTLWFGYIAASESECLEVDAVDFCIATNVLVEEGII